MHKTPVTVQHDLKAQRFYAVLPDRSEAELQYRQEGKALDFFHTYVPEAFRTEGIAEQVVQAGFEYAKQATTRTEGLDIRTTTCGEVITAMRCVQRTG